MPTGPALNTPYAAPNVGMYINSTHKLWFDEAVLHA